MIHYRLILISIFVSVLCLHSTIVFAQTNDMQKLCENIENEILNGDHEKAIRYYNQAVKIIKDNPDSLDLYIPLIYSSSDIFPIIIGYVSISDSTNVSRYIVEAFNIWYQHLDMLKELKEPTYYRNSIIALNWTAKYLSNTSYPHNNLFNMFFDTSLDIWYQKYSTLINTLLEKDLLSTMGILEYYTKDPSSMSVLERIRACRIYIFYSIILLELEIYKFIDIDIKELVNQIVNVYEIITAHCWLIDITEESIINMECLISEFSLFRKLLINKLGAHEYDKIIEEYNVNNESYVSDIYGYEQYENLLSILLNIKNGNLLKCKDDIHSFISNVKDGNLLLKYKETILKEYEDYGLKEEGYEFLQQLNEYFVNYGREDYLNIIQARNIVFALDFGDVDVAQRIIDKNMSEDNLKLISSSISVNDYFYIINSICYYFYCKNDWANFEYYSKIAENLTMTYLKQIEKHHILPFYDLMVGYCEKIQDPERKNNYFNLLLKEIDLFSDNGLLPEDNRIAYNLAHFLIDDYAEECFENGNYEDLLIILKECLNYFKNSLLYSSQEGYCNISLVNAYEKIGDDDSLNNYYNDYYKFIINHFNLKAHSLTEIDRSKIWGDYSICLEYASKRALINSSLTGLCYNFALLQKNHLLKYNIILRNNIYNSQDEFLIKLYEDYIKAVNENKRNVRELELQVMRRYSYHPEFRSGIKILSWQDVSKTLNEKDVAIEFSVCYKDNSTSYAALILKKEYDSPLIIELCSESEIEQIISKGSKLYQQNDDAYSYIWEKLEPYLDGVENIYFAPHGLIHQMNIEVLAGKDGIPMNKKYNVYRVSSTGNLVDKREDSKYSSATLFGGLNYDTDTTSLVAMSRNYAHTFPSRDCLLGDIVQTRAGWSYLPGTAAEVNNVSAILEKNRVETKMFTDKIGTEESFKALSGNSPSIIHIATHGFYLEDKKARRVELFSSLDDRGSAQISPLKRSGLMFSGGQHAWLGKDIPERIDDGVLTAEEIAGMNLSGTDLLVLSACQTGLGEITSSGVEGLQKGFKIAGVNTIIMSLWEVSDVATETMMTTFYKNLTKGKSKREAFDKAVEAVKKKYPSPEYWATFIMLD